MTFAGRLSICIGTFLVCGNVAAQSNQEEYSRKACIELFSAKELALTKFSVSAKFDAKLGPESGLIVTSATEEYAFADKSEACQSRMQTTEGKVQTCWWRFDGTKTEKLTGSAVVYEMGEIKKGRHITWQADPRNWLCYSGSRPLSEMLQQITDEQFSAQVVTKETRPMLRLTLGPIRHEGGWGRGTLEFDIERGHALLSQKSEVRFREDQDWVVSSTIVLSDFRELNDDVWAPGKAVETWYETTAVDTDSPTILAQKIGEISDWKFGDACDMSVLSIEYPDGLTVVDSIKNKVYTVRKGDF